MLKQHMTVVAAAAFAVLAFTALPSLASAAAFTTTPSVTLSGTNGNFTSTGGPAALLQPGAATVNCTGQTNAGTIEGAMTGTATITLTGCTESTLGTKCATSGKTAGTIVTEALPFHFVYLKPANAANPHERPGILFTPNANGNFATYTCTSGLVSVAVSGTGVLGTVTSPAIGGTSASMTIDVSATSSDQQHTETVEGQVFGLNASVNGATPTAAFENAGKDIVTLQERTATTNTGEGPATTNTGEGTATTNTK